MIKIKKIASGFAMAAGLLLMSSSADLPEKLTAVTGICTTQNSMSLDNRPVQEVQVMTWMPEDIDEEIRLGEMEMVSILVQAEAGNQGLKGMQLVADVILNRVDSGKFPNSIEEVIYQDHQFGPIVTGTYNQAAWEMSENAYRAVEMEWNRENRLDQNILYFNTEPSSGKNHFKYGGHYFGY